MLSALGEILVSVRGRYKGRLLLFHLSFRLILLKLYYRAFHCLIKAAIKKKFDFANKLVLFYALLMWKDPNNGSTGILFQNKNIQCTLRGFINKNKNIIQKLLNITHVALCIMMKLCQQWTLLLTQNIFHYSRDKTIMSVQLNRYKVNKVMIFCFAETTILYCILLLKNSRGTVLWICL